MGLNYNRVHHGLCLDLIKQIPDNSINCVITSPPYWQLRDYGFKSQWGMEKTYEEYLVNLWSLMDEIKRVLTCDGTVWINIGDTYGTRSGSIVENNKAHYGFNSRMDRIDAKKYTKPKHLAKCQLLLPHRFAIGCIDRGWKIRNDIIWAKRVTMPESSRDRFSKKHEYIFFMVKSNKYYFDLDSVREEHSKASYSRMKYGWDGHREKGSSYENMDIKKMCHVKGKNPGDVSDFWDIPARSSGTKNTAKHYAKFSSNLISGPILAGCPYKGVILDPFAGSGTTILTAIGLDRYGIGFDGKMEYCNMANKSIEELYVQNRSFFD
jgi:DNA modification methylase